MFKVFIIAIVIFFIVRRFKPATVKKVQDLDLSSVQKTAENVKEQGRCLLIQVIVLMIKGLTNLLGRLISTQKQINK